MQSHLYPIQNQYALYSLSPSAQTSLFLPLSLSLLSASQVIRSFDLRMAIVCSLYVLSTV